MTVRTATLAAAGILLYAVSLAAHHNMTAIFDLNDRVSLAGTLTRVDWRNPHIYIDVEAKREGGKVEKWTAEGPAPAFFRSRDTSKADFEKAVNKAVTLEVSRARDGSQNGLLRIITLPGGKVVSLCPQNC
jgi:hypothetical protein